MGDAPFTTFCADSRVVKEGCLSSWANNSMGNGNVRILVTAWSKLGLPVYIFNGINDMPFTQIVLS